MITIDGSVAEGGGQILRYALGAGALVGTPITVNHIRANRSPAGLRPAHLTVTEIFRAWAGKVTDATVGSTALSFYPEALPAKSLEFDIKTAGSVTLVLQSLLLPMLFASGRVAIKITGGTDVPGSIPTDTFANVILPWYAKYAQNIEFRCHRRGYFPKGDGLVELIIHPKYARYECSSIDKLLAILRIVYPPLEIKPRPHLRAIQGNIVVSKALADRKVAERILRGAETVIRDLKLPLRVQCSYAESPSVGGSCSLWAIQSATSDGDALPLVAADGLIQLKTPAEEIGASVARTLVTGIKEQWAIDPHTADSLLPLVALLGGSMHVPQLTDHLKSAIAVFETLGFGPFIIDELPQKSNTAPAVLIQVPRV